MCLPTIQGSIALEIFEKLFSLISSKVKSCYNDRWVELNFEALNDVLLKLTEVALTPRTTLTFGVESTLSEISF